MDQIVSNNALAVKNCIFHPKNKVTYIQINEILTQHNSKILLCLDCVEQDLQFKGSNHMLIQKIIENSETDFHLKWPPLNDQSIIQKIQLKASSLNSTQKILDQINSFFTQLKDDIIQKVDVCQKKAMKQAEDLYFGKEKILKRYQEISQIQNFKTLLIQNENSSYEIYQKQCKEFIQKVELQKDKNTEQLQELLNQCEKNQKLVNFDKLNQTKAFILDFFDSLNIFEHKSEDQFNINRLIAILSMQQQDNSKIDQLMQLISNKTNYCNQEFLNGIRQQLQKLSFFFEQISFEKMNQQNKKAIRFSELNDEKIMKVNQYVDHLIEMQNNPQYLQSVKNSQQIQKLQRVFNNQFNFIQHKYRDIFIEYLIETFPFLKNINTDQMHSEEQSFTCLNSLQLKDNQSIANGQTQRFQFQNVNLLQSLKQKSIINEIQLFKSNLSDGNQRIEIIRNMNNQFEISINETNYKGICKNYVTSCISQVLKKDEKYKFRIQFENGFEGKGYFLIGLMQKKDLDSYYRSMDMMNYYFQIQNNKMNYKGNQGIEKFVKGNNKQLLDQNTTLELRVWLQGQQLEVLDYPNYNQIVQIKDEYKQNLLQNDLCLYFWLCNHQDKYILKEALIVDEF